MAAAVTVNYGVFIQQIISFLIVAFAIFVVIRAFEKMERKEKEKPAAPSKSPAEEALFTEIRDLLKNK